MQLVHRLRDQDPSIAPASEWLDEQLARQGTTAEAIVRGEHQRQVAGSVTVRNIITSMHLITDVDWTELFEHVSLVDDVFKAGSAFEHMDLRWIKIGTNTSGNSILLMSGLGQTECFFKRLIHDHRV